MSGYGTAYTEHGTTYAGHGTTYAEHGATYAGHGLTGHTYILSRANTDERNDSGITATSEGNLLMNSIRALLQE